MGTACLGRRAPGLVTCSHTSTHPMTLHPKPSRHASSQLRRLQHDRETPGQGVRTGSGQAPVRPDSPPGQPPDTHPVRAFSSGHIPCPDPVGFPCPADTPLSGPCPPALSGGHPPVRTIMYDGSTHIRTPLLPHPLAPLTSLAPASSGPIPVRNPRPACTPNP